MSRLKAPSKARQSGTLHLMAGRGGGREFTGGDRCQTPPRAKQITSRLSTLPLTSDSSNYTAAMRRETPEFPPWRRQSPPRHLRLNPLSPPTPPSAPPLPLETEFASFAARRHLAGRLCVQDSPLCTAPNLECSRTSCSSRHVPKVVTGANLAKTDIDITRDLLSLSIRVRAWNTF